MSWPTLPVWSLTQTVPRIHTTTTIDEIQLTLSTLTPASCLSHSASSGCWNDPKTHRYVKSHNPTNAVYPCGNTGTSCTSMSRQLARIILHPYTWSTIYQVLTDKHILYGGNEILMKANMNSSSCFSKKKKTTKKTKTCLILQSCRHFTETFPSWLLTLTHVWEAFVCSRFETRLFLISSRQLKGLLMFYLCSCWCHLLPLIPFDVGSKAMGWKAVFYRWRSTLENCVSELRPQSGQ